MTNQTNISTRVTDFTQVASPALLEATAAALLTVANNLAVGTPGERQYLAQVAGNLRSMAHEKMTGAILD